MLLHFSVTFGACKMEPHERYMHRCLHLAKLGEAHVAPNPMVGSVLVYNDRIIGEGYHMQYGQPHAEVNCINSVPREDEDLISRSTLYVSLEPCAHFGKTPPCADLIIAKGIKQVVIGCRDPFEQVNGKGIEKLRAAGVQVVHGVLEQACKEINKRFFTFHLLRRPFILLKWAQTTNGIIGREGERLMISNEFSHRLVHQMRAQQQAILVGTNTARNDNPVLNTRLAAGPSPIRLVIDKQNSLPVHLNIFNNQQQTIIFNNQDNKTEGLTEWYSIDFSANVIEQILQFCYLRSIQSILVEGGAKTLQSFIDAGLWDEAVVIQNMKMFVADGVHAPRLQDALLLRAENIFDDKINYYKHQPTSGGSGEQI